MADLKGVQTMQAACNYDPEIFLALLDSHACTIPCFTVLGLNGIDRFLQACSHSRLCAAQRIFQVVELPQEIMKLDCK
jgi:hypothetical protein